VEQAAAPDVAVEAQREHGGDATLRRAQQQVLDETAADTG
jgi:hypothetical protein